MCNFILSGRFCITILLFLSVIICHAQVSINGPSCAIAGGNNGVSYCFSGNYGASDNVVWKVSGGMIVSSGKPTFSGNVSSSGNQIRIIWNRLASNANIQLTCGNQSAKAFSVNVVTVDSSINASSTLISSGAPQTLNGGSPTNNSCSTYFSYWWEVSDNPGGPFTPLDGEWGQNLQIKAVLKKSYYRRVYQANGENFYSNVILLDIKP
jgi:hypothetical protein